jgi:hypothetical protein
MGWALAMAVPALAAAQATAPKPSEAEDKDRAVAGGGITAPGWTGKVDAKGTAAGLSIKDSKFEQKGDALHLRFTTKYGNFSFQIRRFDVSNQSPLETRV